MTVVPKDKEGNPFSGTAAVRMESWDDAAKVWHWRWQIRQALFLSPHLMPWEWPLPSISLLLFLAHLSCNCPLVLLSGCSWSHCLSADARSSYLVKPPPPLALSLSLSPPILFLCPRHHLVQLTSSHLIAGSDTSERRRGEIFQQLLFIFHPFYFILPLCVLLFFPPTDFEQLSRSRLNSWRIFNAALS